MRSLPTVVVALAGRQNSGKTSLMMHATGSRQRPVNFPGSSVERAEATTRRGDRLVRLIDLPGIASTNAISPDEQVSLEYLRGHDGDAPDVMCVVADASKLSVELRLLSELMALDHPVVVALTKNDVARAEGRPVDAAALAAALGVRVVEVDALRGTGVDALIAAALATAGGKGATFPELHPDELAAAVQATDGTGGPTLTDRIDAVVLHPVLGLPLLLALVYGVFQLIFSGADPLIGLIETAQDAISGGVEGAIEAGALRSFLVDGLINGVGSILVFLPQIVILIALVSVLEGTGYMARAAFLLDRALSRVGLSGRSFVPMVSSFACAVPGILAARIIDDERDRLATIVTAPLMSCSARLPVYVVLIGAFFPTEWAGAVLLGIYLLGVITAALVAWALRRTVLAGDQTALMMELPTYQPPSWRVVFGQVVSASRAFMVLAGTVIFGTAILIWVLSYYPRPLEVHERFEAARVAHVSAGTDDEEALARLDTEEATAYLEGSYLAQAGKAMAPAFAPAGFDWRITVGILAAFPARELIVPTLGILYSVGDVDPGDFEVSSLDGTPPPEGGLRARMRAATDSSGRRTFNPLVALSLMVFFALCSQCAATLGTIRRETRSWRWPIFTFAYMTVLAWIVAVLVYQAGAAAGLGLS